MPERVSPPIAPDVPGRAMPLSSAQQRFWFFERFWPGTAVYNRPMALRLHGPLAVAALERALNDVVARHAALRTVCHEHDGTAVQTVLPPWSVRLPVHDPAGSPLASREAAALRAAEEEVRRPFEPGRPPFRSRLLRVADEDHILVVTVHHSAYDGWSSGVLRRELSACYDARVEGREPALPPLLLQPADHAAWQAARLAGERGAAQLAWWRSALEGATGVLELPADRPRPASRSFRGGRRTVDLDVAARAEVERLARQERATPFMVLLAAFAVLLQRCTGEDDLVVGCPIAGRTRVELEGLVGCFINTLPLRIDASGEPTFRALVGRVRATALGAFAHQELPLQTVVESLRPDRDAARPPLFQTMFNFRNLPPGDVRMRGLDVEPLDLDTATSLVDLSLDVAARSDGLQLTFEYDADLFDADTVDRFADMYRTLLQAATEDADAPLSALPIASDRERRRALDLAAGHAAPLPAGQRVHDLIAATAARTPDAVAVVAGDRRLTYAQLHARSAAIAHALLARGVGPGVRVGVCLRRSADLMAALVGVLRAGGAYVPLDPDEPAERLAFMLADTAPRVVLTHRSLRRRLGGGGELLCVDDIADPGDDASSGDGGAGPDDAAYVMYTSGSTGRPKGVTVTHRGLLNHNLATVQAFGLGSADRVLQFASVGFDGSVEEIFPTWIAGGTLVLRTDAALGSARALLDEIARRRITVLDLPTAFWHEWVAAFPAGAALPSSLRLVVVGGEQAYAETYRRWRALAGPHVRWLNTYGPTEATVVATMWDPAVAPLPDDAVPPIGRPLPNVRTYVVDGVGRLQPVGVPGELWIGGAGVARGYHESPELTAARFRPDPFHPGGVVYGTGDRARFRADGLLEFMGRLDDQVKVRGFRIEPGEVEAALRRHARVRDAVVVARDDGAGGRRLVAYVVGPDGTAGDPRALRSALADHLPAHMVPAAFVRLQALPRTAGGKVDRRMLPSPPSAEEAREHPASGPSSPTERRIARIWRELLGTADVGVHDDFFALGGHSLLALRLAARIETELGVRLPPSALFQGATVAQLARRLATDAQARIARSPLVPIQPNGSRPPLFFVHEFFGDVLVYGALARRLGPDQPFYGLQARGLEGDEEPLRDVAVMAALYTDAIRTVQPVGPYALGGLCAGGVVALEMARQLRAAGDDVRLIALLDSSPHGMSATPVAGVDTAPAGSGRRLADWVVGAAELTRSQWSALLRLKGRLAGARLARAVAGRHGDAMAARIQALVGALGLSAHHAHVGMALREGLRAYAPEPYDGPMVLFRPRMQPLLGRRDPTRGWSALARGGLDVCVVPGNHLAMLQEPHVRVLASELAARLAAGVDARARRPVANVA